MPSLAPHSLPNSKAGTSALLAAKHTKTLLHNSERFFPPLNIVAELGNLVALILAFVYRDQCSSAKARMPYLIAAFCFYISITVYVFQVMLPINRRFVALLVKLEKDVEDEKAARDFERVLVKWRMSNFGVFSTSSPSDSRPRC